MRNIATTDHAAHLVESRDMEVIEIMGPTIQFITGPDDDDNSPCIMRGTIPAGLFVPLHSHAEPETFLPMAGEIDALAEADGDFRWVPVRPGDVFHVPGGAKHAFRNRSGQPAVMIIVSKSRLGRFFQEVGTPAVAGQQAAPPSPETIRHFLAVADRYGYWNATPAENARIGLALPPMQ